MQNFIIIFLCKILDKGLSTLKDISLYEKKYLQSALLGAVSTFFYMVAISNMITDNSFANIISITLATFLGSYLPGRYLEKRTVDKLYVYEITVPNFKVATGIKNVMQMKNIPTKTIKSFDEKNEVIVTLKAYAGSKTESAFIKEIIGEDYKYHAYEGVE